MAKKRKKRANKINPAKLIKMVSLGVFAVFAGILVYVSVFIWQTLGSISAETGNVAQTSIQGIQGDSLTAVEKRVSDRIDRPMPTEEAPRNPFKMAEEKTPETTPPPAEVPATMTPEENGADNDVTAAEPPTTDSEPAEPVSP